jgi:hypothetical protein
VSFSRAHTRRRRAWGQGMARNERLEKPSPSAPSARKLALFRRRRRRRRGGARSGPGTEGEPGGEEVGAGRDGGEAPPEALGVAPLEKVLEGRCPLPWRTRVLPAGN